MGKNIYLLTICQAALMSNSALMVAASGLIGLSLAENKALATVPISFQFLAMMLTSIPAANLMGTYGRRFGFSLAAIIGIIAGVVAIYSIMNENFWLFCIAAAGVGIFNGFGNHLRFAAAEMVEADLKTKAISYTLLGGVIAAFIGPNMANFGRSIYPDSPFSGGFIFVTVFYLMILIIVSFVGFAKPTKPSSEDSPRPFKEIYKQAKFIVAVLCGMIGFGVMSYVMTATPLAMKHHHHDFTQTSFVIQWHVFAMFAPSFFTGNLCKRFGILNVMLVGALFGFICIVANLSGTNVIHFWLGLFFLGLSWNFLFIGATSLLTQCYQPSEAAKVQGFNDFCVFTTVTIASLTAGVFQHHLGWEFVNYASLPALAIAAISLIYLKFNTKEIAS